MPEVLDREKVYAELEAIRAADSDGVLYPKNVVQWARENPESTLHGELEWDDAKAAEEYRTDQARAIIRVVVVQSKETPDMIRAYVSQPSDRVHGGGYRRVEESLAKARAELVNDALRKLATIGNGFTHLPELAPLFDGIKGLVQQFAQAKVSVAA